MTLEQLKIILGIEAKGFAAVSGIIKGFTEGANRQFAALKNQVAGFFTVAAGTALVRSVSQMAERWKDLSEQTGLSTDAVQKYDFAFKKVGLTAEAAAQAFDVLTDKRREALESGGTAEMMFRKFGISEDELRSLNTGAALFERMAKGRRASNQGDRELFAEAFGAKRGGKLLASAAALEEGGPPSLMSEGDLKALDQAAKDFANAALQFKIAAGPLVVALTNFATKLLKGDAYGIENEIVQAAETNAETSEMEWYLANAKRKGISVKALKRQMAEKGAGQSYDDAVNTTVLDSQGRAGEYSKTRAAIREKLGEAFAGVMFRSSSADGQRGILKARMSELNGQAANEADPLKRAGIQSEMIKLAGQRAEMGRNSVQIGPDSLAAVGGIVGGAGMMDPGISVEQDQLSVLRDILREFPELKKAIEDLNSTNRPIDGVGGLR